MSGVGSALLDRFTARYPRIWHVIEAEGADCETLYPAGMLRRFAGGQLQSR